MAKKRVYEVVNNNPNKSSLRVGDEEIPFNRDNFMYVDEADKGEEIKKLYDGGDAIVNETEVYTGQEAGHKYFFGVGSKRYEDNYERIFRKRNGKSKQTPARQKVHQRSATQ